MKQRSTATVLYAFERKAFTLALCILFVAVSAYIYFICLSVVNVIIRAEADRDIASINTHISTLESRYIEAKELITITTATERGFVHTPQKVYVTKTPANLVLSQNDES